MKSTHSLLALAVLATVASAQTLTIPDTQNTINSGTSTTPFAVGLKQFVYDTTHFTAAGVTGPITIDRLRFRGADGVRNLGGHVYSNVTVQLGTAAVDYLAMTTTFATNRGTMGTLSAPMTLTTQPISGAWTNDTWITIDLAANGASFTYDPTLGADLLIEMIVPTAPVPATNLPSTACSSTTANGRGQRVTSGTVTATTGTLSGFDPVINMDFTGPGGYTSSVGSWVENRGAGCGQQAQSFYQFTNFIGDRFDLRNGKSLTLTPDNPAAPNFYVVTSGTTAPDLSPAALGVGAPNIGDDTTVATPLGFTFNFPGGSTTDISQSCNGFIWLASSTLTDLSPTVLEFRNSLPRLAIAWMDQHCGRNTTTHPGSGMYTNVDLTGGPGLGKVTVTWKEIGQFNAAQPGANVNTFQCEINENGVVEMRYGACNGMLGSSVLTGFSRGGTVALPCVDPGNRDLEVETPFTTTLEGTLGALTLAPNTRPFLSTGVATNVIHTLSNLPATTVVAAVVIDFSAFAPSIPLPLGNAGCMQTVVNPNILDLAISPVSPWTTIAFTLPLGTSPNAGGWMGGVFYTQGVTLDIDGSGALTTYSSNAIKLALGLL